MTASALVLGGGGVAGIAWEVGVLAGLAEAGVDVNGAELVVGTSAGSVVAAALAGGAGVEELYGSQDSTAPTAERAVDFDASDMLAMFGRAVGGATDPRDARARIGAIAGSASDVPESERRNIIESRLPRSNWPERRLLITAVDTGDGSAVTFDRSSGVALVDAVAASCAVPGVWPPVTIGDRRYMDGGMHSVTNAGLARGAARVLIVAPMRGLDRNPLGPTLDQEVAELEREGRVYVIAADQQATEAFGCNPLDPATRQPSAQAGLRQGRAVGAEVRAFWTD